MNLTSGLFTKLLSGFLIAGIVSISGFKRDDLFIRYMFKKIEKKQIINRSDRIEDSEKKKFTAEPVSMDRDNWLTNVAGGRDKNIAIEFGEVTYNGDPERREYYLDLIGENQTESLASNGASYTYYEDTVNLKTLEVNFLTGKKLLGNDVVKDYTNGKEKIVLIINYDESGNVISQILFVGQMGQYPTEVPLENYYNIIAVEEE